jgi:hypothetical protein
MHKKNQNIGYYFSILLILIFITSCKEATEIPIAECLLPEVQQEEHLSINQDENSEEPKVCILPIKSKEANLTIDVNLTDFDSQQQQKMLDALERFELVVNSEEFKQRVLNHEYEGEKTFVDNGGFSNEEIYKLILDGAETLNQEVDSEIDLDLTLYYKSNSTVGWTRKNTNRIWVNDNFFKGYTLAKVAKNVSHEWVHKLGFGHAKSNSKSRPFSVPYGIGNIVKELIEKM